MKYSIRWICILVALLIATAAFSRAGTSVALAATDVLDQSQTQFSATSGLSILDAQSLAQTFTAGRSGILDRISLALSTIHNPPFDLTVQIETTSAGLPSGTVIGAASVPASALPQFLTSGNSFIDITLSTQPGITSGTQYAVVLSCGACPFSGDYGAGVEEPNTYPGGQGYFSHNGAGIGPWLAFGGSLAFKTYVVPVPTSKDQCKDGGWEKFMNPDTGKPFENQGECVSWVELHPQ